MGTRNAHHNIRTSVHKGYIGRNLSVVVQTYHKLREPEDLDKVELREVPGVFCLNVPKCNGVKDGLQSVDICRQKGSSSSQHVLPSYLWPKKENASCFDNSLWLGSAKIAVALEELNCIWHIIRQLFYTC